MFVTLALVSASCCLTEIRQLGRRGATWELEAEYKFQRRSCKLSFLFPPAASWAPRRACSPAIPNCVFFHFTSSNKPLQSKKIRISLIGRLDLTIVEICGRTPCDKSCKNSMEWNDYCLFCFCSSYSDANAVSGDHPNWQAYLIRPTYFAWLGTRSTHWRATCRYDTDGVVFTDYMRTSLADCNILTLPTGVDGTCYLFEFINIRGHECVNCTVPLWNINGTYPLHTDTSFHLCEFNGTEGVINFEDNFGLYRVVNPSHRCSSGPSSTTQFWLGGKWTSQFF